MLLWSLNTKASVLCFNNSYFNIVAIFLFCRIHTERTGAGLGGTAGVVLLLVLLLVCMAAIIHPLFVFVGGPGGKFLDDGPFLKCVLQELEKSKGLAGKNHVEAMN